MLQREQEKLEEGVLQREQEKLEEGVLQREHERRRKECCNENTRGEGRSVATKK